MRTTQYIRQEKAIAVADSGGDLAAETARLMRPFELGHIYAIEFGSGTVKVGKTSQPKLRLASFSMQANAHGGGIKESWISGRHCGYHYTERELIRFCARFGTAVAGREYFRAPFAEVRSYGSLAVANRMDESTWNQVWQEAQRQDEINRLARLGDLSMTWQEAHERLALGEDASGGAS